MGLGEVALVFVKPMFLFQLFLKVTGADLEHLNKKWSESHPWGLSKVSSADWELSMRSVLL